MIRTCLEFLLSRALDDGSAQSSAAGSPTVGSPSVGPVSVDSASADGAGPFVRWLRRRVQLDVQLKQFDAESRQLDALLRSSAAECRQALTASGVSMRTSRVPARVPAKSANANGVNSDDVQVGKVAGQGDNGAAAAGTAWLTLPPARQNAATVGRTKRNGISAAWLTSLAVAAVLLLVVSPGRLPDWFGPTSPTVHAGEFSQQLTVVPGEVLRLITRAAETSRTQLPQLSPLANLSLPAWEDVAIRAPLFQESLFQEPLLREIDTWQESWKNFKLRLPASQQEI